LLLSLRHRLVLALFFLCSCAYIRRHSFPTRRSSDLVEETLLLGARHGLDVRSLLRQLRIDASHDALDGRHQVHESRFAPAQQPGDRKSTRLNSSHGSISYAVVCLEKKKTGAFVWRVV